MPEFLTFFRTGDIRTACFLSFLCGYTAAVFPAMFWGGSIAASLFLVHLYPHPTGNRARGGGRRPSPISPASIHYTHKREEMLFVVVGVFFSFLFKRNVATKISIVYQIFTWTSSKCAIHKIQSKSIKYSQVLYAHKIITLIPCHDFSNTTSRSQT